MKDAARGESPQSGLDSHQSLNASGLVGLTNQLGVLIAEQREDGLSEWLHEVQEVAKDAEFTEVASAIVSAYRDQETLPEFSLTELDSQLKALCEPALNADRYQNTVRSLANTFIASVFHPGSVKDPLRIFQVAVFSTLEASSYVMAEQKSEFHRATTALNVLGETAAVVRICANSLLAGEVTAPVDHEQSATNQIEHMEFELSPALRSYSGFARDGGDSLQAAAGLGEVYVRGIRRPKLK